MRGFRIVFQMMHDLVATIDRPFGKRPVDKNQLIIGVYEAVAEDTEVESGEAGLLDLECEVLHLPATREFPAWLTGLRNLNFRFAE